MNDISTEPTLLDVELPSTLIESPSVSTFLPDEEASICPLLSNNSICTPQTLSHPLTPNGPNDDSSISANLCNEDCKAETSSSSGSSSGIAMHEHESAPSNLFNKHSYQHLSTRNNGLQEGNGHCFNGNLQHSQQTPSFVSWNWPAIRKCTFLGFMSALLAMCTIVVAMIVTLPKTCNPKTAWYRGTVFYEVFPVSFQDSNSDGFGDIRGITNSVDYLASLGVAAVRLNSIFPSPFYPEDHENITSLVDIAPILGGLNDIKILAEILHDRNMTLILDIPVTRKFVEDIPHVIGEVPKLFNSSITTNGLRDNLLTKAIQFWIQLGVDGFYIKYLENVEGNFDISANFAKWKQLIGINRVLLVSESTIDRLPATIKSSVLSNVDLIDVRLNVHNGTQYLEARIKSILENKFTPNDDGAWIHWSLGENDKERVFRGVIKSKFSLAATIMQLMLPGTPNIFNGDEVSLEVPHNLYKEHRETKHLHHFATMVWSNTSFQLTSHSMFPLLPTDALSYENLHVISNMIKLRDRSPSIYKNSICKQTINVPNTQIRRNRDDILIIERIYPRRNSFVSVTNFDQKNITLDMTSLYYSGNRMLIENNDEKVFFGKFEIGPHMTIVVKLDK